MTVISSALVLQAPTAEEGRPIIGWDNRLQSVPFTVSTASPDFPASNLPNPSTSFPWKSASNGAQTITISNGGAPVDYIGIARHNLNQSGRTLTIRFNGAIVYGPAIPSRNQALMFFFGGASPETIIIEIGAGSSPAVLGYLALGQALVLQRGIYVGHTPITYARDRKIIKGLSESGQYLGEVIVRSNNRTGVSLQNLTPDWYRNELDPIFRQRVPFFWAWYPSKYAAEVGYVWLDGEPNMSNQRSNGMVEVSMSLVGMV